VPRAVVGQVLDRFPERGERLLRLVAASEGEQRRQAPHQGARVVGLQGQQERRGLQGLLVLLRGQGGPVGLLRGLAQRPDRELRPLRSH